MAQNDSLKTVPVEKLPLPIKSPANIRHVLVLPIIARSIETGWSFGLASAGTFHLKSRDTTTRTSNAQALALYTTRKQFVVALNGSIYFPGERFIINEQLSYSSFPDNFWGLGKRTADSSKESYKYKQYYIYLHPQLLVAHNLFLGLVFEHQRVFDVEYTKGRIFDKENIPGRYGYHISGLGLSVTYDNRNNAFSPDKGGMMQFWFDHFASYLGSDYQYTNFVFDLRRFIRIYKGQVLALQAFGSFNAGTTPLRSFAYIGGASNLRGYYAGRFRDKDAAIFQAEYRIPLFWRLGATGFAGIGNVGPKLSDIDFQDVKYSYGGGLRLALNRKERLNLRLDYGFAKGPSQGFYLQIGEAF
ncbi:MAG: BamA/TamA family outer membrane protein [Bacteroidetes bacterium]|nr:BamA/TamA family outer membrane protein [Bacteroidota bacterium]